MADDIFDGVDGGVEADQGIAGAKRQAPVDEQRDAAEIVGRDGSAAGARERAGQAQVRASLGGMGDLAGDVDQFVDVAQLGDGGGHDAGRPGRCRSISRAGGAKQVILQLAERQVRDDRERCRGRCRS